MDKRAIIQIDHLEADLEIMILTFMNGFLAHKKCGSIVKPLPIEATGSSYYSCENCSCLMSIASCYWKPIKLFSSECTS